MRCPMERGDHEEACVHPQGANPCKIQGPTLPFLKPEACSAVFCSSCDNDSSRVFRVWLSA